MSRKHSNIKRYPFQTSIPSPSQQCKLDAMHDAHMFVFDRLYRREHRGAVCLRMLLPPRVIHHVTLRVPSNLDKVVRSSLTVDSTCGLATGPHKRLFRLPGSSNSSARAFDRMNGRSTAHGNRRRLNCRSLPLSPSLSPSLHLQLLSLWWPASGSPLPLRPFPTRLLSAISAGLDGAMHGCRAGMRSAGGLGKAEVEISETLF